MQKNKAGDELISKTLQTLVSVNVPTCSPETDFADIVSLVMTESWADISHVFVVNSQRELVGFINLAALSKNKPNATARELMRSAPVFLKSSDSRQDAIVNAVKHDIDFIPVVDQAQKFAGVLVSKTIIDLMHAEHLEHVLLTSGLAVQKHKIFSVLTAGLMESVGYRLPWLVLGLLAGLGLGLISSGFEDHLRENIAIAYFIPVIAYIADSVGTQSEAIAIRSLATLKINNLSYLTREFITGTVMGVLIGLLGGLGAFLISSQFKIGIVVGLALFAASAVASVLASAIPMIFKAVGKDPALGSGPLATALQDILSVVIYFLFVSIIL